MPGVLLFVYGTLMRGECRHHYLEGNARFLREDSIRGTLVHLGEYPGLVLDHGGAVMGELYRVPEELLTVLDAMEGDQYERVRVRAGEDDAWTYRVRNPGDAPVIQGGSWREGRGSAPARR